MVPLTAMYDYRHSNASTVQLEDLAANSASVLKGLQIAGCCVQGVYVHVPFCMHRCHYCDFYTVAGRDDWRSPYVTRLLGEASQVAEDLPGQVETMFIGGGTPTYLEPADLKRLLDGLAQHEFLQSGGEWTVEANPETVTPEVAGILAEAGVNRVSLGAQSFRLEALAVLERWHDPESVPRAMSYLRQAGIEDLSLDLIFAVPDGGVAMDNWSRDLDDALSLKPTHLSCYGLTYEPGTPLRRRLEQGRIDRVDNDVEADLYRATRSHLAQAGLEQYEISNWSKPDMQCRHNLGYWRNVNWWPMGPSASGHIDGIRWRNMPRLGAYIQGDGLPAIDTVECLDADGRAGEALMLGLRCTRGVPRSLVEWASAQPARGTKRAAAITLHIESGLLAWQDDSLVLTGSGMLLADGVLGDLL